MSLRALTQSVIVAACLAIASYGQSPRDDSALRSLITKFANARNAHDGEAAADTYAEDEEYFNVSGGRVRGHAALAALWCCMKTTEPAVRTVRSIEFVAGNVAIVRVTATFRGPEYPGPTTLNEMFVVIRDDGQWKIRVHEATRLSTD
jgi:uncharacterized protein (TIGR02246 family)